MSKLVNDELIDIEIKRIPELKKKFENVFESRGGVADLEEYDYFKVSNPLAKYYREIQKSCAYHSALLKSMGNDHTIYCDFIDSPLNNAFATTVDNISFIGICIGNWVKLNFLFGVLEKGLQLDTSEKGYKKLETYSKNFSEFTLALLECNEIRKLREYKSLYATSDFGRFSGNASIICIEFIFMHEFHHIILGHTQLLNSLYKPAMLCEIEDTNPDSSPPVLLNVDFQTIELEADCYSGLELGYAFDKNKMFTGAFKMDYEEYAMLLSFSLAILFQIFDIYGSKISEYNSMKHPHPDFRYVIFYQGFKQNSKKIRTENLNKRWIDSRDLALALLGMLQIFSFRELETNLNKTYIDNIMEQYQENSEKNFIKRKPYGFKGWHGN